MQQQTYRFEHHGVAGAVIRILDDETLSLNEFLTPERQSDDAEDYDFAYTAAYINYSGKHVLVDAGFDPDTVPGALESLGIEPEEIDLVLLTHADSDHIAGLLMQDGGLTYPNAEHVIGKMLWENLRKPETLALVPEERAPFFKRFVSTFEDKIRCCEDGEVVSEGVRFVLNHGHRVGHAVYEFSTAETPIVHTGDAFFHPVFAEHPDWVNRTDSLPEEAVESRRQLVPQLAAVRTLIMSSHIPFPGLGYLRKSNAGYHWETFRPMPKEEF